MIGLVDYDIQVDNSNQIIIPNLEIMKLATYYKLEQNIFCRLINLNETELNAYDKVYFFSETSIKPEIPAAFLQSKNVTFGGTAFTGGIYQPFKNSIVDYTIARPTIYKEFLKNKYNDGVKTKVIGHVLDDSYYRIFLNGQQLPIPPIHPNKRLIIYDRDLFCNNWENILDQLSNRKPSSIYFIHPIVCTTLTNFFKVRSYYRISRTNIIILDLNIPLSQASYMLKHYKNLFLADINKTAFAGLFLGGSFATSTQYYKDFIYKMNLLFYFWSHGIEIKIKYDYPKVGHINPLENIELLIETWTITQSKYTITLEEKTTKRLNKEKKEIFQKEKEQLFTFYPEAKDLFKQTFNMLKEGGYWRL